MRLLILGGTTEASKLARILGGRDDLSPILSLAGRTENPREPPIPLRVGGFGGLEGLTTFLLQQRIEAVVDATHPFAERISANAIGAAAQAGLPLVLYTRPPWSARPGADWRRVPDLEAAALTLGHEPRRVLVTSGRLGLSAFRRAPQHHYIVRSIDPPAPEDCPPHCEAILARGPFETADEATLMRQHGIEILVTKNSGGDSGAAKLDAARALDIPVVMVDRPVAGTPIDTLFHLDEVLAWIERHRRASSTSRPSSAAQSP